MSRMERDVEDRVAQEEAKLQRRLMGLMEAEVERSVTEEEAAYAAGKRADIQVRSWCDESL